MRIKRLELKVELEEDHISVFHTDLQPNRDPPTIIVVNGKEFEGTVSFKQLGNSYNITITKAERTA